MPRTLVDAFEGAPPSPSLAWRAASSLVMGTVGTVCRAFLFGANKTEVTGLDGFLRLLDERQDVNGRERGLVTVSNHLSIADDPLTWGTLPFRYHWSPDNNRWSLGSHDIMFKSSASSKFFTYGQCLPTHRAAHSIHGGLFQPTITQAIRLLSAQPFNGPTSESPSSTDITDPFSAAQLTYTTNGQDSHPAPSAYLSRRHAWIHIFPEGRIHQHPDRIMRYFKWGVSRLILESDPCPDVVPIWIEGFEQVYHESRTFPRPVPRAGNSMSVTFGHRVDTEKVFGDLRERWKTLCRRDAALGGGGSTELGVLSGPLKYHPDAVRLREECTMRIREEVLKLRRDRGWPDEDPKARKVDTWREEGGRKREGRMEDGSWVRDT